MHASSSPAHLDPVLERWRLVLGSPGQACLGDQGLSSDAWDRDVALDWLYGRDADRDRRDIRSGGRNESLITTVDWLQDVVRLFPKETVERLERDAIERYGIEDVVTNQSVLESMTPNQTLLTAVLRAKRLMSPTLLRLARRLVERVIRDLVERMASQTRQSFSGTRSRRPQGFRQARDFDVTKTIRRNLGDYRPDQRKIYVRTPYFASRHQRRLLPWQVILLVDQSGSMMDSVVHSAVTASCLWGLPGVRTHLITFDSDVVDLTSSIEDPVEVLMRVQLGGGTDIARAVGHAACLISNPRRAIVVLITDFFDSGPEEPLIRAVRQLVGQGTEVLGLAALDENANPSYHRELAQRLADVGAHVGAMTPGQLASFIADRVGP